MSRFLHPNYANLEAYTPGEQPRDRQYTKLNTNESPYPPSPEVLSVLNSTELENLRLYSDPEGNALCEALAKQYNVAKNQVFISSGSDDTLNFAFMAFAQNGAVFPSITYSFYPVFCDLHHIPCERIPLNEDFTLNPSDYFQKNKLIVLTNPNAPTGLALTRAQIRSILEQNPDSVVLLDEAYVDFGAESAVPLLAEFENLLVVMTFSKSRSLAGARLGFALGSADLISDLNRLKYSTNPYNVNRLTLRIGEAALASQAYFDKNCQTIMATRTSTTEALQARGFSVLPSLANFVFAKHAHLDGAFLYAQLKARGVLVRHWNKAPIAPYLRITIGTEAEMQVLLQALDAILKENPT